MSVEESVAKAAALVRHSLPVNAVPQTYKNDLVDAIALALFNAYTNGLSDGLSKDRVSND